MGYEIHPETPPQGSLLRDVFPSDRVDRMYEKLQARAKEFDITFGNVTVLSNSSLALQAGEFARDQGLFDQFHEALSSAYFTEIHDIGNMDVILAVAESVGVDKWELGESLREHVFLPRLEKTKQEADRSGITGVPTFIIDGSLRVVGAQPLYVFRNLLREISGKH